MLDDSEQQKQLLFSLVLLIVMIILSGSVFEQLYFNFSVFYDLKHDMSSWEKENQQKNIINFFCSVMFLLVLQVKLNEGINQHVTC